MSMNRGTKHNYSLKNTRYLAHWHFGFITKKWNEFEVNSGKREVALWLFSALLSMSYIFWLSFWLNIIYLAASG